MPSICFFDAAGTLFELTESVGFHYAKVGEEHGLNLQTDALNRAFRVAWKRAPTPLVQNDGRADDDRGWWRSLVEDVFKQVEAECSDEYFDSVFRHFVSPGVWRLYPETREILEYLQPRTRLGIISNFDKRLYSILESLGIRDFFEMIVVSSEAGADKPHPQIFELALKRADVGVSEALHVGDDPEADWLGAEEAGLRVFKLERPKNDLLELKRLFEMPVAER